MRVCDSGQRKVSFVHNKWVNFGKNYMSFLSGQTKLSVIYGCPY